MTKTQTPTVTAPAPPEHFDVLIVGAGLSGIGGAYHLRRQCPWTRFLVLDAQDSYGGTWLTHTYPGVRSDSDLYTYGYRFKPWTGPPIATGAEILTYLGEVIEENDLGRHIRYRHRIVSAHWSSDAKLWTLAATRARRRRRHVHREFPLDVSGLLPACPGIYAGLARHERFQG